MKQQKGEDGAESVHQYVHSFTRSLVPAHENVSEAVLFKAAKAKETKLLWGELVFVLRSSLCAGGSDVTSGAEVWRFVSDGVFVRDVTEKN